MKKDLNFKLVVWLLVATFIANMPGSVYSMDMIRSKALWAKTRAARVKEKTLDRLVKQYRATQELRRKKADGTATPAELKELKRRMNTITRVAASVGILLAIIVAIAGGTLAYREYQKRERRMLAEKEGAESAELLALARADTAEQRREKAEEEDQIIAILAEMSEGERDEGLRGAIDIGDAGSVERYLRAGANGNAKDRFGNTPLHRAININWVRRRRGHDSVVQLLIAAGVNINAKDGLGNTPLHLAVEEGRKDVSLLLNAGADPSIRNNQGQLPVDVANYKVKRLLRDEIRKRAQAMAMALRRELPRELVGPIVREYAVEQPGPERGQVFFKTLTGRTITLEIERDETVAGVKERLKEKYLEEREEGSVYYAIILMGEELKDEDVFPLSDAAKVATLHVVLRYVD